METTWPRPLLPHPPGLPLFDVDNSGSLDRQEMQMLAAMVVRPPSQPSNLRIDQFLQDSSHLEALDVHTRGVTPDGGTHRPTATPLSPPYIPRACYLPTMIHAA